MLAFAGSSGGWEMCAKIVGNVWNVVPAWVETRHRRGYFSSAIVPVRRRRDCAINWYDAKSPVFMRVRRMSAPARGECEGCGTKKITNYVPPGLRDVNRFVILGKSARGDVVVCSCAE